MRSTIFNGKDVNTRKAIVLYCIDPQFLTAFLSLSKNGDKKKSHRKKWRWRRRRRRTRRRKTQRPRHHIHDTRSTLRGWSPPALAHVGVDVWSGDWRVPRRWTQKQTTWGPTMKRIGCVASSCILYIYIYMYFVSCPEVFLEILKMATCRHRINTWELSTCYFIIGCFCHILRALENHTQLK